MNSERQPVSSSLRTLCVLCVSALSFLFAIHASSIPPAKVPQESAPFRGQSQEEADRKSSGCISCHTSTDEPTMHPTKTVHLGCTDCHGGNSSDSVASGAAPNSPEYNSAKERAHVQPRDAIFKNRSNLPERTYTKWLAESNEFVKFVNPGDLRVAPETCGASGCHAAETRAVSTSMMTHGGMLWGAALYNNGSYPAKNTRFGESYGRDGLPQSIKTSPRPTTEETRSKGVIPELDPLFRWETSQPGNVLRVFERGGRKKAEIGNPNREEDPGKPDDKLSDRGFGTGLRTDPVFLGLQKTRLLDPVFRSDHSQERVRPSHQTRLHALHTVEPMHDLPHPSRHEHGHHLFRPHLVGQRNRWRQDVPEGAA